MGGLLMYKKLDNDAWEEYLNKYKSIKQSITVKDFCSENNLNKGQFYYHKRRLEAVSSEESKPIFHGIALERKEDRFKRNKN